MPGEEGGMNATVCGVWLSTCTATLIGLSGPMLFSVGETRTFAEIVPLLPIVLKL